MHRVRSGYDNCTRIRTDALRENFESTILGIRCDRQDFASTSETSLFVAVLWKCLSSSNVNFHYQYTSTILFRFCVDFV